MTKDPWEDVLSRYEPGARVRATVQKIAQFGAFVEIEPGLDGLILIPNVSHERIRHPSEKLTVGQQVEAVILVIDPVQRKMSLSTKALERPVD